MFIQKSCLPVQVKTVSVQSHKTDTLIQELLHKTDMSIRNCRIKHTFIQELLHKTDMLIQELLHKTNVFIHELSHKTG